MFDVPDRIETIEFHGGRELIERLATVGGFENAFAIHIGRIGPAFAGSVVDFVGVIGV